ncbi:Zn-dependent hydrolase [Roseofilum sp. BLCC_M91]|uniref:Zn-dependent hydrolase n=1 Tax=Roseofilum halophilum BLCC-M91 TaxID=3022259 RepID=A0ABT7BLK5_9CYAN|nr:Zn-dependent hydrolase [Roseofilum halophilum]MDJ1179945.1 Zn-dependent hydrolase [Roseofilum halophilum BLCC-M91]
MIEALQINAQRLQNTLEELAKIGQKGDRSICRLAFSDEDLQARALVHQWMEEAGMKVRVDSAGNLRGTYPGKQPHLPILATGSHLDTVPSGGKFDGALGVVAGIEIIRVLNDHQHHLNHPLEIIVFTDEENTMIGCKAISGTASLNPEDYQTKVNLSIIDALDKIGGNWHTLAQVQQTRQDIAAFIELHVEQGAILEQFGKQIGIVQGIVGQQRYTISIKGQANHAGTTPMNMRQDALTAAARIVLAVEHLAHSAPGDPVATVGAFQVFPNAPNIIPGLVKMTVDIRDLDRQNLNHLVTELKTQLEEVSSATQTQITIEPLLNVQPTLATPKIQQQIATVCQDLGLTHLSLPSRASHDAQELGRCTDMGMIFVPSQGGISHSGKEYTPDRDCVQGAMVLLHTLLKLDREYN